MDESRIAGGETQVRERFFIYRKEAHCRAVFRGHVGEGGAIGKREAREAGAVKFDELADDAFLAKGGGDGEDEIGGSGAFGQAAVKLEADDWGNHHREWLAEHRGFGFDAADAPAEDAEAIDHCGVRVGADERIRIGEPGAIFLLGENDFGEVFEIYLVADAGVGRDDLEIVECFLAPAEESVALDIAKEFDFGVEGESAGVAELIDLHRVVNDEIGGEEGIDFFWIATEIAHGFAHCCQVHDCGDAGEILQ